MTTAKTTPTSTYEDIAKKRHSDDPATKAEAVAAAQKAPNLAINDVDNISD